MTTRFETFLNKFDEAAWHQLIHDFLPSIHEVDRNAVQIWFRFYPLSLFRYLEEAEDREKALQKFVIQGDFELKNQIDSSHKFLFGHRFWNETKHAISARIDSFESENGDLNEEVKQLSKSIALAKKVDESLTLAITLAGLMTLVQVGAEAFKKAEGKVFASAGSLKKSAKQVVEERAKETSQGIFGFLKTIDKQFEVSFDAHSTNGKFKAFLNQEITSAAANCNVQTDARCIEGPIPVECKSASCGTCWVGILGGQEKLSEVQRLERKQMKVFGYQQPEGETPFMRLACQAKVSGTVSIVIPPWNGVFGKKIYGGVEDEILQAATTAAAERRKVITDATNNLL